MSNSRTFGEQLYQALKADINGQQLEEHLMRKYDWTVATFHTIDWKAHGKELKKLKPPRRTTVSKFIHGWLATNTNQHRVGRSNIPDCPLCGVREDQQHLFCCSNPMAQQLREHVWLKLIQNLGKHTATGLQQVFTSGLQTALGAIEPDIQTKSEWPGGFRQAFETQSLIGCNQVFYGRIACQWEQLAHEDSAPEEVKSRAPWTCRAIRLCWDFGIQLWVLRNQLVHDTGAGISQVEMDRVERLTEAISAGMKHELTDLEKRALHHGRTDADGERSSYAYKKHG